MNINLHAAHLAAVTLELPTRDGDAFEHADDGTCWCQPLVEDVPPDGRIFIHRRTLDSPHVEPAPCSGNSAFPAPLAAGCPDSSPVSAASRVNP